MTNRFLVAVQTILKHEGGYVNDPDDPGGATNFGISLRFLLQTGLDIQEIADVDEDGDVDVDDIRAMEPRIAKEIYYKAWWKKNDYDKIESLEVATKIFDMAVNMGSRQGHKLVQRACRACGIELAEDGILGPRSMDAINSLTQFGRIDRFGGSDALIAAMRSEQAGFYRLLIATNPRFKKYERGWLRRAYA